MLNPSLSLVVVVTQNLSFQIIIPSCWIFSLIMNIPEFVAKTFEKSLNTCIEEYPEKWMGKAYSMTWLVAFAVLTILIMVALYSTVVYKLWFKGQEENKLSRQQKVHVKMKGSLFTKFSDKLSDSLISTGAPNHNI